MIFEVEDMQENYKNLNYIHASNDLFTSAFNSRMELEM